jgi:hypothetical protein
MPGMVRVYVFLVGCTIAGPLFIVFGLLAHSMRGIAEVVIGAALIPVVSILWVQLVRGIRAKRAASLSEDT